GGGGAPRLSLLRYTSSGPPASLGRGKTPAGKDLAFQRHDWTTRGIAYGWSAGHPQAEEYAACDWWSAESSSGSPAMFSARQSGKTTCSFRAWARLGQAGM